MADEEEKKEETSASNEEQGDADERSREDLETVAGELGVEFDESITDEGLLESVQKEEAKKSSKDGDIEYFKKIAEDERTLRKTAEGKLADKRFKSKRKEGDEDEDEDEDKPLTGKELRDILAEDRKETRNEFKSSRVKEIADELTDSEDESSAVIEIFNGRTFPSHMTLEKQMEEAYFIAHGPRLLAKRDELRRSLRSKKTKKESSGENVQRDTAKANEPKISPQDKAELQRLGFTWDGKNYTKKLQSGKTLVKDWKTKKVYVLKKA